MPPPVAPRRPGAPPGKTQERFPECCTKKENLFILEYLKDANGARAYRETHPRASQATAEANSHKLLKRPRVIAALAAESKAQLGRLQMDADEALVGITRIARADIRGLFTEFGSLKPMKDWPDEVALVVKSISETKYGKRLELYDKLHALETIAKIHKLLKDSVVVEVPLEEIMARANALQADGGAPA